MSILKPLLLVAIVGASAFGAVRGDEIRGNPRLPAFEWLPAPEPGPAAPGLSFSPPTEETAAIVAELPIVFEHTADAGPDQTFCLTGERLGNEIFVWGRSVGNSGGAVSPVRFLVGTSDWLTANLDITAFNGPFLVWVRNDAGWSRPIRLNVPQVWWCWPARPAPGQALRLFGRDLAQRPDRVTAHVWLARPGQSGQWLTIQKAAKYELHAALPADLAPGRYQLWVHAGQRRPLFLERTAGSRSGSANVESQTRGQNVARDMRTGFASGSGSDGVVFRRTHAYFWHGESAPGNTTAFRVSRPRAAAWVNENTVEGASAGGHDGIRLLEKPETE